MLTLIFWLIQSILNIVWCILFLELHSPLLGGTILILILTFLVLTIIYGFKVHKWAAYLLIPYLLWTIIMGVYIWEIIFLNY